MKKSILFLVFFVFTFSLLSQVPDYEFIVEPTELMFTYFDYMPGGYNSIPIRIQPEISQPCGYPAGGTYIVFHAQELGPTAERKVYYCYLDSEGNLISTDLISTNDVRQGYPGVDIDPISCDPLAIWHALVEPDGSFDCLLSADLFHEYGSPGNWTDEFSVIDNPIGVDDEFIWPAVHISGFSPLGGDYRRVYVTANNYVPCQNVIIGYADINSSDLWDLSLVEWNYRTIEQMNAWNNILAFKSCTVYANIVVYAGYLIDYDNALSDVFVLVNENYGEGPFEYYSESCLFDQWNPLNEDGTAYLYSDESTPLIPYIVRQEIWNSSHMNVIIKEYGTKISWSGAMGITFEVENSPGYYYPAWCQVYPKEFVFDLITHEFSFYDLYIEGANPNDNIPMCPWDLDEDGIVDSFSVTGDPLWVKNWPIYYPEGNAAFHENYFKTTQNENWMVSVWSDGTKAKRFYDGDDSFAAWEDTPEIAIIISADYGQTWSQPVFLNANETPEMADQIPCYVYPGDVIEILSNSPGNYRGKVHLFYLDDNDFGSYIQGNGLNNGGILTYVSLDIEFPDAWGVSIENEEVPQPQITMYNCPNPFNPETTIYFSNEQNQQNEQIIIEIYNIKGQKIRQYSIFNSQSSIVWDGKNDNNEDVSSGVYLYKLSINDKIVSAKKCLLLK